MLADPCVATTPIETFGITTDDPAEAAEAIRNTYAGSRLSISGDSRNFADDQRTTVAGEYVTIAPDPELDEQGRACVRVPVAETAPHRPASAWEGTLSAFRTCRGEPARGGLCARPTSKTLRGARSGRAHLL